MRRYKSYSEHERTWEETDRWDLSAHFKDIDKMAATNWLSVCISNRALVFTDNGKVKVITLNTAQLLNYNTPMGREFTTAKMVRTSF